MHDVLDHIIVQDNGGPWWAPVLEQVQQVLGKDFEQVSVLVVQRVLEPWPWV